MRNNRSQFVAVMLFLVTGALVLASGFQGRIGAQGQDTDVFREIAPIAEVLDDILKSYVREPDTAKVVEGALRGMMNSLDEHSAFIPAELFKAMEEETMGEFEGIGVYIQLDPEDQNIRVQQPIPGYPAERAGIMRGDIIFKIDGESTKGMSTLDAAQLIRGPRGTKVKLVILRTYEEEGKPAEFLEIEVIRGLIPIESIEEARLLDHGIGYVRVTDFKSKTAGEIAERIEEMTGQGMKGLILDLRWNPGGLLNASQEVSELFLPNNTLVTYTKVRNRQTGELAEDMRLLTTRQPVIPETVPMIVLVNENTASSSEIVTGALQYYARALIVGAKTYGKGSVQTLMRLNQPEGSALKLTTGLYYTPADVTIDREGIRPDVEVPMTLEDQVSLRRQMRDSFLDSPDNKNAQNHGAITGNGADEETVEDVQLQRAVDLLLEEPVFENLIAKYHKDPHETQMAASEDASETGSTQEAETPMVAGGGREPAGGVDDAVAEPVPAEAVE